MMLIYCEKKRLHKYFDNKKPNMKKKKILSNTTPIKPSNKKHFKIKSRNISTPKSTSDHFLSPSKHLFVRVILKKIVK